MSDVHDRSQMPQSQEDSSGPPQSGNDNETDTTNATALMHDPAEIVAYVLTKRVLDASPGLREFARGKSIAVVVEVPGPDWVDPVAEAWRVLVQNSDDVPEDGDEESFPCRSLERSEKWCEIRRDGRSKSHRPDDGNARVAFALSCGRPVYGFSPSPERYLPADLLRVAERRVVIPSLDSAALTEVIAFVTGKPSSTAVPESLVRNVTIADLRLAKRPDQEPEAYVECLTRLVQAKSKKTSLTLDDLHGMEEAAGWGRALARDLAEFRRGRLPWSDVDKGVLLYGLPGTGKTTFAKALAASCDVPLVTGSLAQWQAGGHLGDLLKLMRKCFEDARAAAPCIVFIDEIDAFGDRATFTHDHRDYSTQVVNGLLEELDGVAGREGVVAVGACNRPDFLDPALTRSGRLDRAIYIPLPNRRALVKILRYHLGGDLPNVDLSGAAILALGGTGADCEKWVRGARRRARYALREMALEDLLDEIRGSQLTLPPDALRRCAIHEAGHALVVMLKKPGKLMKVTIRQTSASGGGTGVVPDEDPLLTRTKVADELVQLLAGRAAEEVLLGDISGGAGGGESSDLARATALAIAALCSFGLGEGDGCLLWRGTPVPEAVGSMLAARPEMADRVSAMLAEAYRDAKRLIRRYRRRVDSIANVLLDRESVDGQELEGMFRKRRRRRPRDAC